MSTLRPRDPFTDSTPAINSITIASNLVARSGMASIFRATDLNNGRQVAIKIPHPEVECDPALFERFRREEEIGKLMDHPA
jgi:serine/threonine protein kinase